MGDSSHTSNRSHGILRNTQGFVFMEWYIADYKPLLQQKKSNPNAKLFLKSPPFEMRDTTWILVMSFVPYPGVFITLVKNSDETKNYSINCHMKIQINGDVICGRCSKTCQGARLVPFNMGITEEDLLRRMSLDALKVLCTFYSDGDEQTYSNLINEGTDILSSQMKDLFLKEENCDFAIKVKDRDFKVHKAILSARSPVLSAMLHHDMAEKNSNTIDIVDCDPDVFERFLLYLYSGQVEELSWSNATHLYSLGDKYDVPHLRKQCVQFMEDSITIETFCDVIALAVKHKESALVESATDFFQKNVVSILGTIKWQLLMRKNPSICNELYMKHAQMQPDELASGVGKAFEPQDVQGVQEKSETGRINIFRGVCEVNLMLAKQISKKF